MKYILATLRLISWDNKETGEQNSCYAYTSSGASSYDIFGSSVASSFSARIAGQRVNSSQNDVTLWLNDMTEEEYDLYVEQGNTQAYIAVDGDVTNPRDIKVISTQEFNALQNPQMLFATTA